MNTATKLNENVQFPSGVCVMTSGVQSLASNGLDVHLILSRHLSGDWGDLEEDDKELNSQALIDGSRLFSSYLMPDISDGRIYVITEADRSVTTLLLPSEY
jgi:hypothetical protein